MVRGAMCTALCVALALVWTAPWVLAQDAGAEVVDEVSAADVTPAEEAATDSVADEGAAAAGEELPDPSTWVLDPEGRVSKWLALPPIDPADLRARPDAYADTLASHGLALDIEGQVLAMRGAMLHDRRSLGYPIEYLVVTEKGKTYEACVLIRGMPSVIDACLQAMGLEPGSPTTFTRKEPAPTDAEIDAGVSPWTMRSAGGDVIDIAVSWIDDEGRSFKTSLESLLVEWPAMPLDPETGELLATDGAAGDGVDASPSAPDAPPVFPEPKPLEERGWIFCGSTFASYRQGLEMISWHRGDTEGDVIAIYLDGRRSCLVERNSLDGLDGSLYTLEAETMPAAGTPVTLLVTPRGERVEARDVVLDRNVPDALRGDPSSGR